MPGFLKGRTKSHAASSVVPLSALLFLSHLALFATASSAQQGQSPAMEAYKRGLQDRQKDHGADALKEFNLAIKLDPKFAEAYFQKADLYCGIGQSMKGLDDCNKVIALDPDGKRFPRIYVYRAEAYHQLEEPEKVLADCTKAAALGVPDREALLHLRVYACKNLDKIDECIKDQTTILEHYSPRPNTANVYRGRAELYEYQNKFDKAEADLQMAIKIKPSFDIAYTQLARVHGKMNQPQKQLADYDAMIKLSKNDEVNYYERGRVYLKMARYNDAIADFNKSIELMPSFSRVYDYRAEAYTKMGKTDLAAKDRAKSAELKDVTNFR